HALTNEDVSRNERTEDEAGSDVGKGCVIQPSEEWNLRAQPCSLWTPYSETSGCHRYLASSRCAAVASDYYVQPVSQLPLREDQCAAPVALHHDLLRQPRQVRLQQPPEQRHVPQRRHDGAGPTLCKCHPVFRDGLP